MNRWPFLLMMCVSAASCAIGQSEYSCSGIPEGVQCHNARDVLEASKRVDGPVTNSTFGEKTKGKVNGAKGDKSDVDRKSDDAVRALPVVDVPDEENGALPLRTPSRVMRIWYAPWQTADGDLHIDKIVYTEIEARRWTIGNGASVNVVKDISPLESAPSARNNGAATPRAAATPGAAPSADIVPQGTRAAVPTAVSTQP